MKYKNNKKSKFKNLSCPNCKSEKIIKWGKRRTENRGKVQRYCCKSCSETFIHDPFYRMRNAPQKITCALDLFFRGLSTREVQNHFTAFYPHNSDHSTILRWVRKYSLMISEFTDKLKVRSGSYIEVDEMEYHRRKYRNKKGTDKNWLINAIDIKTRFMLNSCYVRHRSRNNLKGVLRNVKYKTGEQVKICTTDGLTAYDNIVKKNWGYDHKIKRYKVEHKVVTQSKGEGFNIWVERLHNTIRQRTTGFRGLHGSLESAYAIMKGIEIFYNFVKKHEALQGRTPSELAVPELELKSANKWLELINLSNQKLK